MLTLSWELFHWLFGRKMILYFHSIFALRAQLAPMALKGILLFVCSKLINWVLVCFHLFLSWSLFSCLICPWCWSSPKTYDLTNFIVIVKDCPDLTFPTIHFSPNDGYSYSKDSLMKICWRGRNSWFLPIREQISTATATADICESVTAVENF